MSENLYKAIKCDRCERAVSLRFIENKTLSGGFEQIAVYEERPKDWVKIEIHNEVRDLCPNCHKQYRVLMDEWWKNLSSTLSW